MKINLVRLDNYLIPADENDMLEIKKLSQGSIYSAEIKLSRNYEFFKKFHKLIRFAWEYQNEKTQEFFHNEIDCFRDTVLISAGWTENRYYIEKKVWYEVPKSISFESMKEEELIDLYPRVFDVLLKVFLKNISEEEFNKNLSGF
jgi:hypothetical protein